MMIVAEISASHDGELAKARQLIDGAEMAGADAIKLQTFEPELIAAKGYKLNHGPWKGWELQELYRKAHTPKEWHKELFDYASEKGLTAFSTPFHQLDVDFLESIDCPIYKISSFDIINIPLIKYIAQTGKPIIMSNGMATLEEISEAIEATGDIQDVTLLHCISSYPAKEFYLDTMTDMQEYYTCNVGISDHTKDSIVAIAATALGAQVIEKHICLDHNGLDGKFALLPEEFKQHVKDIKAAQKIQGVMYGPKPSEVHSYMLRPSLHYTENLPCRSVLEERHLTLSRPNDGAPPFYSHQIIGKRIKRDVKADENVNINDIVDKQKPIEIKMIDWDVVFIDLEKVGQVGSKIKDQLGIPWSTFRYYRTPGYEPKESIARALLEIHTRYCGEELTQKRIKEAK